jgi:hypothetical protein
MACFEQQLLKQQNRRHKPAMESNARLLKGYEKHSRTLEKGKERKSSSSSGSHEAFVAIYQARDHLDATLLLLSFLRAEAGH